MKVKWIKVKGREKRHKRIRGKIVGTIERPRLSIRRSTSHLYAQVIDDTAGKTLVSFSTLSADLKDEIKKMPAMLRAR
jgi:large subunit ribosomal protein L18